MLMISNVQNQATVRRITEKWKITELLGSQSCHGQTNESRNCGVVVAGDSLVTCHVETASRPSSLQDFRKHDGGLL